MSDFEVRVAEFYLANADDNDAEALTASEFGITMEAVDYIMQCYAVDTLFKD